MNWSSLLQTVAKKVVTIAVIVVIGILINPLVTMKPYGQYLHAAITVFFVYYVYGKVI